MSVRSGRRRERRRRREGRTGGARRRGRRALGDGLLGVAGLFGLWLLVFLLEGGEASRVRGSRAGWVGSATSCERGWEAAGREGEMRMVR